jgi:hypothetical protein
MNATDVALQFVEAINSGDVDRISSLMATDHLFIDSGGRQLHGQDAVRDAWSRYLVMFPDYRVEVREALSDLQTVVLLGRASATFPTEGQLHPENRWSVPAAWRAVVSDDRIAVWQVFADNEPACGIMRRCGHEPA